MLGVGLVCVSHTKAINTKGKRELAADASEDLGSVFAWYVAGGLEVEFESVVGNVIGFLQSLHAFPNFH